MTVSTVVSHICRMIEKQPEGVAVDIRHAVSEERESAIQKVIEEVGVSKLTPIKARLPPEISYDEIWLVATVKRRTP